MRSHHRLIVVLPLAAMMLVQGCSSNAGFGSITAPRREGPPSAPEVVLVSRSDTHDGLIHFLLKNRGGSTAYNVTVQSVDDACGEAGPQYSSTPTNPSTIPPNTYADVAVPCQSFEFCMYIAGVHWDPQP